MLLLNQNKTEVKKELIKADLNCGGIEHHKKPMIYLFDFEENVHQELKKLNFNVSTGSFGSKVKVNPKKNKGLFLQNNNKYPPNLHEYDIVMLDLTSDKTIDYKSEEHELKEISGKTAYAFFSSFPEKIFDPTPYSIKSAFNDINGLLEKKSIIIAFCGEEKKVQYDRVAIHNNNCSTDDKSQYSNYNFYYKIPTRKKKYGKKVSVYQEGNTIARLLDKHLYGTQYHSVFRHPVENRAGRPQKTTNFFPLLLNHEGEVISYAHYFENSIVFVFPNIKDKPNFISELFKTYLPEVIPEIFPFHGEFKWLESGDYPLPGELALLEEKIKIKTEYDEKLAQIDQERINIHNKFNFLSDLITESGESLVAAIEHYLNWLGFDSVVNLDETMPDYLEEDIQVNHQDKLLVVEIKGIGGTSTDSDCSQVSKIRYRRIEKLKNFNVYGLYIVNHQRYIPPKSRKNPPFSDMQINDAQRDKRGLLTTYDLYKSYFLIEEGILDKNEIRDSFFKTGLISFEPENLAFIGIAKELFKNGEVVILNIDDTEISVGDTLIIKKQGDYFKTKIQSLQINGKPCQNSESGEVGIQLDRSIKKNSKVYKKNHSTEQNSLST